jgi:hypothetical protein
MGDAGRAELERLEGSIDRSSAEVTFRVSLIAPLLVCGAALIYDEFRLVWAIALPCLISVLVFQIVTRQRSLVADLRASAELRYEAREVAAGRR